MYSIHILMKQIIDYAGLFPPAALAMQPAVASYAEYRQQEDAWALGRFILPVSRLSEFEGASRDLLPRDASVDPWHLSVLGTADLKSDLAAIQAFNRRHTRADQGAAQIDTIELKAASAEEVLSAMQLIGGDFTAYFEIPIASDPQSLINAIGRVGGCAKVRTGGTRQEMFPDPGDLIRFIDACVTSGVPFKATAGLHHPLRSVYRLTYDHDSATGTMYGFLNVFLSTAFVAAGMDVDGAMQVLLEESAEAFRFEDSGILWRNHRLDTDVLSQVRQQFAISFGSCSFQEPIDELKAMQLV
ncbi:MAG TPA: hypothetical protein VFZ66_25360 [Herpetosiphonaceae bacterium]